MTGGGGLAQFLGNSQTQLRQERIRLFNEELPKSNYYGGKHMKRWNYWSFNEHAGCDAKKKLHITPANGIPAIIVLDWIHFPHPN